MIIITIHPRQYIYIKCTVHVVRSRRIIVWGCNSTPFTHTHTQYKRQERMFFNDTQQFKGLIIIIKKRISPNFQFFFFHSQFRIILTVFFFHLRQGTRAILRRRTERMAQQWRDDFARRHSRFISIISVNGRRIIYHNIILIYLGIISAVYLLQARLHVKSTNLF